jgi:NhaA family Na+:H+ antiporter
MTIRSNYKNKRNSLRIKEFEHRIIHSDWIGGIILLLFALIAITLANLPATSHWYHWFFGEMQLGITIADRFFGGSLEYLINDGLMVIFFFHVGLEIKREIIAGQLSSIKRATLPIAGALGGMLFPALIYSLFNINSPETIHGFGIPTATDIAFAVGVLSLLGNKVPLSAKIFLTALAIADDLGAIIVIALFYPSQSGIDFTMLIGALVILGYMYMLQRYNVYRLIYYIIPAIIVWILFLNSGIHATIAGVLIAMTIPATPRFNKKYLVYKGNYLLSSFIHKDKKDIELLGNESQHQVVQSLISTAKNTISPSQRLEYGLHGFVSFIVMPAFALANSGVSLTGTSIPIDQIILSPVFLGIFFGLVVGKPLGITLLSWICVKLGLCEMPQKTSWNMLMGVACLGGIGFTMSIFVTNLAFTGAHAEQFVIISKTAILISSLTAGILGFNLLNLMSKKKFKNPHNYIS